MLLDAPLQKIHAEAFNIAGLAGDTPRELLVEGYAAGSLSMASYTLGMSCATDVASTESVAISDFPHGVPMTRSNMQGEPRHPSARGRCDVRA